MGARGRVGWRRCGRWQLGLERMALALALLTAATVSSASEEPTLDEILEEFEDDAGEAQREVEPEPPEPIAERWWSLDGSLEFTGSINYLDHASPTGTDYTGVSRLRTRLNLRLDLSLPRRWRARIGGHGFYDPIYAIRGRSEFTSDVLDEYEWEAQIDELFLEGAPLPRVDVKLGRQVVVWGRFENLRVLDILNPLDNREPGREDLRTLRLPVSMARVDVGWRRFVASAIAIPEIRFSQNPVRGSDFFPSPVELAESTPDASFENTQWAGSLGARLHRLDVSLHGAYFWRDRAHVTPDPDVAVGASLAHARQWMVGLGMAHPRGNWLFKLEVAWFDGREFFWSGPRSELAAMVGVEYYGFTDTLIALELKNNHIIDFDPATRAFPDFARRNEGAVALRVNRDFWSDLLHVEVLGLLFGWEAEGGAIVRATADYDLIDDVSVGVGILFFFPGEVPPADIWGRNDRVLLQMRYSF